MAFKSSYGGDSSSSPLTIWWKYDVFVSFRGEDTRKNFTDHLCAAMDHKGIITFRDDQKLERGKPISAELLKAIEESRFSVIVFSRNYASSSWCLDELVKIVECMELMDQIVLPIFYDVTPTEVRKQTGSFEDPFHQHEAFQSEKAQIWRAALTRVANLSGWDLQDRHESTFIHEIVEEISSKLSHSLSSMVDKDLVGVDSRLQNIVSCLGIGLDDVRIIGICGMGGIGKTTMARIIYDRFSYKFDGSSFVANVREVSGKFGLATLQEQLLSQILREKNLNIWDVHRGINIIRKTLRNKRALIILDDVDKLQQLEALAGEHEWFCRGSRIIITTRDEHLLIAHGVDVVYKAENFNDEEALQLLSLKAFKRNNPAEEGYVELSKNIVRYTNGLPLALVVLGSFLCGRSVSQWRSALKRLKEIPNREIFDVLKISYDGLGETEKKIFLDISCFFSWKELNRVTEVLDACDFYPEIGIKVLIDKSLISISNNRPYVHNLLREMALTIVHQESSKEPGKRSRLWLYDDIYHVLTNKTGTGAVEVIYQSSFESKEIRVDADAFARMNNLRLLKVHDVNPSRGLNFLPRELRIFKWQGYPLKSLPSNFKAEKLFKLIMCHSQIEQLWQGIVHLYNLKIIKLSHSQKLIRTPDFRGVPNLEKLILEGCTNLYEIHPSIGDLKRLVVLNLKDCRNLQSLPSTVSGCKSLKVLLLLGCSKIDKLPEKLGDLECLEELDAGKTAITEAPSTIVQLKNLEKLSFRGCKAHMSKPWNWLGCLLPAVGPSSMSFSLPPLVGLWSLTQLDLSDCNLSEGAIPIDVGLLSALTQLNLSRNDFVSLPTSINQLSRLRNLRLEYCRNLEALPELPSSIEDLCTYNCSSLQTMASPLSLNSVKCREFSLNNCFRLTENQAENDVVMALLNRHLCSLLKIRFQTLFSKFLNLAENQGSNNAAIVLLARIAGLLMESLHQDSFDPPSVVPKLVIIASGSGVPDWFIHQSTSSLVTIDLPPNWYNDYRLLGLAFCASFEVHDHNGQRQDKEVEQLRFPTMFRIKYAFEYDYKLKFYLLSDEGNFIIYGKECTFKRDTLATSNHLWLLFLPLDEYLEKKRWRHVVAYFTVEGAGFEFKSCGVRLVYMNDVDSGQVMFEGFRFSQLENLRTRLLNMSRPAVGSPVIEQSHESAESSGT